MREEIEAIGASVDKLDSMVSRALKKWQVYEGIADSDWIRDVERLIVEKSPPERIDDIRLVESNLGYSLPDCYIELVTALGAFDVGEGELLIRKPQQIGESYGELIEEKIPNHALDNFHYGHYHDFIICGEYGQFPIEDLDYSYGLAFNRHNSSEIIIYTNDVLWLPANPKERTDNDEHVFLDFFNAKLSSIFERADESLAGLHWEIDFYQKLDKSE